MQSVEQIREELISLGLNRIEANNIKGKENLLRKLEELRVAQESEDMLNDAEVVDDDVQEIQTVQNNEGEEEPIPSWSDRNWSDYVLSHLHEDEKIKGHPKADSLRRLTELLIGDVVGVDTEVVQCPSMDNGGRATVVVTVDVMLKHTGVLYRTSGAADVYPGNTEQLFAKFPVATAETRAEGRAYRKMLRLQNVIAAEELVNEDEIYDPGDKITVQQITLIDNLCSSSKLNIDVEKLLEKNGIKVENLDKLSKSKAQDVCKIISSYQATGVTEDLLGYKHNWRH
jgi:hypothetical protein